MVTRATGLPPWENPCARRLGAGDACERRAEAPCATPSDPERPTIASFRAAAAVSERIERTPP
jgi:hypothetical protein